MVPPHRREEWGLTTGQASQNERNEGINMPIQCEEAGRVLTVSVSGEVDHHAARALMTELGQRVDAALPGRLELDLGGVTFMDSSGIAVVLRTWKRMSQLGGSMTLRCVPPQAAKVLKAAGVDKLVAWNE